MSIHIFYTGVFSLVFTEASSSVCTHPACIHAASRMLKSMDTLVNPCDDFYEYACGGWRRSRVIPEDRSELGTFHELMDEVDVKLKALVEEPSVSGEWESITKAKNYYKSCVNLPEIENRDLTAALASITELGGWPSLSPGWSESSFDFEKALMWIRQFTNSPPIVATYVCTDSKNPDARILCVSQPPLGMPDRDYYLKGRDDPILLANEQFGVDMAIMFGADPTTAKNDMKEIVNFEIKLANISLPIKELYDETKRYNLMTLQNFTKTYTVVNWKNYFDKLLKINGLTLSLTPNEPIINRVPEYMGKLSDIISGTSKRTLANYIAWFYVQRLTDILPKRIRKLETLYYKALYGTSQVEPRWKTCVYHANSNFGLSVGNLFIHKHFGPEAKFDVEEMISKLRSAMKDLISSNDWMDTFTKMVAMEKVDYITPRIGYPAEVDLESKLNKEYELVNIIADDLYHNTLSLWRDSVTKNIKDLREPIDKEKWDMPPAMVNAMYDPFKNQILFPAGILQPPFYHENYPDYLNYGGIGYVIGHEITHGFDDIGRQFDKNGRLFQWWSEISENNFHRKAECMENQYGNYTVEEAKMKLNGKLTLGENIADNGGVRESYEAYRKLVQDKHKGKEENTLPGMELSPDQLFFLNGAQVWCNIIRPKTAVNRIITDFHSDGRSRVIGPLQNFDLFSKTFNCKPGTYMNPKKKCVVWG